MSLIATRRHLMHFCMFLLETWQKAILSSFIMLLKQSNEFDSFYKFLTCVLFKTHVNIVINSAPTWNWVWKCNNNFCSLFASFRLKTIQQRNTKQSQFPFFSKESWGSGNERCWVSGIKEEMVYSSLKRIQWGGARKHG